MSQKPKALLYQFLIHLPSNHNYKMSVFEQRNNKRARRRAKRQYCAKKIQLCWTKHKQHKQPSYPIGINKIFKTLLEIKIKNHENEDLEFYMNVHTSKVNDLIDDSEDSDYSTLFGEACYSKNYGCIPILVKNGMCHNSLLRSYNEEWESWSSSPLRMAFKYPDVKMIEVLMKEGFQTGHGSTCPDCSECGWPETCLFESLFRNNIDILSEEDVLRIIRVSNWNHVIYTYERFVNDWMGKKMLDTSKANKILNIICKTIPVPKFSVEITKRNVDYVMEMVSSNIVNLDNLLQTSTKNLLGFKFVSFWKNEYLDDNEVPIPPISIEKVFKCIKHMIDFGADTSIPFVLKYAYFYSDLPKREYISDEYPYGSFEDIISSVIDGKEKTMNNSDYYSKEHLDEVFNALDDLYLHMKFNKRLGYLQKRVRGFDDKHDDMFIKNLVEMDIGLFGNVMNYLV